MPDPPHPVTDSKSLCNGHLLKIDAHVTGSRPLVISTGDNAPTGSISLASNVLQELTSIEKTQVKYECMTQTDGCYELCIGEGCQIPRWRIGSVILYNICTETFATSVAADSVSAAMTEAISMWGEIKGVVFKEVGRDDPATFRIKYKKSHSSHPNVYAKSFLPRECPSSLVVYQKALENTSYLANILAHELGHIWGLRHEFAPEKEKYLPSVRIGSENRQSIMNYFDDLSKLQVGEQDRKELAAFYAHGQAKYEGLLIVNITAPLHTW
ncbi:uncharacterized protein TrAFT101_005260 [Trichoderma asperellum]|uniref:uncharacterized protein n=1 Tax=Trichoderma asperellum TaxID=101201 RepID=UPI00332E2E67|nr:hypothetical protein TrAFT101_005260 [Trichoderma asperellum]